MTGDFFFNVVLGAEPGASHMLDKCSTTEFQAPKCNLLYNLLSTPKF